MKREWIFSDASLGPYDGFNNAAMDHFRDDNSIFREVIQNSIDNKDPKLKRPVLIKFEKKTFPAEDLGINQQYSEILKSAEKWTQNADKDDIKMFYKSAKAIARKKTVDALVVSDYHTTGLHRHPTDPKSNFYRLILNPGASKESGVGGGSHGHGQHAAYARSQLRTVCFHSYVEKGIKDTDSNRLFIGRTILNSWKDSELAVKRGIGFFCNHKPSEVIPFYDKEVPKSVSSLRDKTGTDIIITAPFLRNRWSVGAISQVVEHFFAAVEENKLVVAIVDNKRTHLIESKSLDDFAVSVNNKRVKNYLQALRQENTDLIFTKNIDDFGEVRLQIAFHEKGNQQIVMVRRPRMKLKEYYKPLLPNYSGILIIDDLKANKIIRNLEDPEHKDLELSRQEHLYPGKNYLQKIEEFIDDTLNELNKSRVTDEIRIPGLGNYLPAMENKNEPGDDDSDSLEKDTSGDPLQMEIDFDGKITQLKPTISNLMMIGGRGSKGGGGGYKKKVKSKGGKGTAGDFGGDSDGAGMSILNSVSIRTFIDKYDSNGNSYRCVIKCLVDCEGYLGFNAVGTDSVTIKPAVINAEMKLKDGAKDLKVLESYKIVMGKMKKDEKAVIKLETDLIVPATLIGCN